jgi:putative transposase
MSTASRRELRLCAEIDENVKAFLSRPIEGDWRYLWIDATYVKVRQNGRIVSVAVIVVVCVNSDGRREILGMDIGPSEAETFWSAFLRKLAHRGLHGVKLVISDAPEGHQGSSRYSMPPGSAAGSFHAQSWRMPADRAGASSLRSSPRPSPRTMPKRLALNGAGSRQLRAELPKLAAFMDEAEADVLAYMTFPAAHGARLHSTNPIERVSGELKRRTEVIGISPMKMPSSASSAPSCSSRSRRQSARTWRADQLGFTGNCTVNHHASYSTPQDAIASFTMMAHRCRAAQQPKPLPLLC